MRPFVLGEARIRTVVNRVRPMAEEQVAELLQGVIGDYSGRHRNIERTLWNNFEEVRPYIEGVEAFSDQRKLLVATFFTMEYAIESAALFNPSMVPGPDQANLQPDEVRVVMSLRATGEGHVSSIEFREAIIAGDGHLAMEPTSRFVAAPALRKDTVYDRHLFRLRVLAMGAPGPPESSEIHGTAFGEQIVDQVLAPLGDRFTFDALAQAIHDYRQQDHSYPAFAEMQLDRMMLLARANYELTFSKDSEISERVVFPVTMHESRGIEDARFVRFVEDDGQIRYLATYTAFDGFNIMSQLLETDDFLQFKVHTLNGRYVNSKGMAFFPRRLHGRYAMISRVDGENLFVMYSDNIHFWDEAEFLRAPEQPWEFMQIGNCGSPLETEAGWLLLTHGVGPMRRYCIGALLLERDNPAHVIGALPWPLLAPDEEEREGYVPNVVYSCGALIHNGWLIIPYAVSDFQTRVASVWLADLLAALTPV
ncbi:MAG: glycoside hydrolase family 130 protein [Candidatus Hydrogenedentes bacterium]|nr:glycoside hydrolase family 130 protein [Candidatus Hydrogenedentota bacterium]MBI3119486.1 glycoside hydrolase family 130 protein [Candidatus Hydrogenedentota bacterium]